MVSTVGFGHAVAMFLLGAATGYSLVAGNALMSMATHLEKRLTSIDLRIKRLIEREEDCSIFFYN